MFYNYGGFDKILGTVISVMNISNKPCQCQALTTGRTIPYRFMAKSRHDMLIEVDNY